MAKRGRHSSTARDEESSAMVAASTFAECVARYELRFTGLFNRGRGYSFPCDAKGQVHIDELTDHGRISYVHARAAVGIEFSAPVVSLVT
jgi:hypothetical protein